MHAARFARTAAALIALAAAAVPVGARDEPRTPQIPDLEVETYRLPNGLEVILHEDHAVPVVAVNLWYKVGSKDEVEGRTGFAHLFEHLMFQGSENHPDEYFAPLEPLGARINGSTDTDRTNYFETVPSNALELALWLEADRMGFLLPALTQESLDNQRDVVKNERRQRVDNVPYGQVQERLLAALYPEGHPYHHSVIGSMADLSAASLEDVKNFFRTHYNPNNASLCIAGDFDPDEARALVETYFGPIPGGPEVEKPEPRVPELGAPVDLAITDRVSLPRVYLAWPTVPEGHPDEEALDVLSAVLGQLEKESRLEKALIYDEPIASQVLAYHGTSALSGTFDVIATGRPDGELDDLVGRIEREIERLRGEGPTEDEVLKARNTTESALVFGLQDVGTRADFFNANNVAFGDPLAYREQLRKLFEVRADDVKRVAREYLTPNRVRIDVTPGASTPRAPEVAVNAAPVELVPDDEAIEDDFDRSTMPGIGEPPEFAPPPVERRALDNGLEVLVVSRPELPILTLRLVVKGGANFAPEGKDGIAELTADLLTEGTASRDAQELAGALSRLGASISASADVERMSVALSTLTKHTDSALELFADVVLNPAFREADLERQRALLLASLLRQRDSADAIASRVFPALLYGAEHPYGRPVEGTVEAVPTITREDVAAFHALLFKPNNAALIVVGDTTADAIVEHLERAALGDWEAGEVPMTVLPDPEPAGTSGTLYLVDRPDSAQSVLTVGQIGLPRGTPDYFPVTVLNGLLGGQFSSRINLNLREDKGYTYGARSSFDFRRGPGPFSASTSVQTAVTSPALIELRKELVEVVGDRPPAEKELADAKGQLILGFPGGFETTGGVASRVEALVIYDLPDDYYTTFQENVEAVTLDRVREAARSHLHPDRMTLLVVGDRSEIATGLDELPFVPSITPLDPEGMPAGPAAAEGEGD